MMNESDFWKLIAESRKRVPLGHCRNSDEFYESQDAHLRDILRALGPEGIKEFAVRLTELQFRAYRWDLWGAAYWEGGGCGDDGFSDFRSTLVSLGRELYEKILQNPDELAAIIGRPDVPYLQAEGFAYIPGQVYEELTGEKMELVNYPRHPSEPEGERWDFDDKAEVARRLPNLFKKLPEGGG